MKLVIEMEVDGSAFEEDPLGEIRSILEGVPKKVLEQMRRPESLCDHPEAADILKDSNGNTVGSVRLE